MADAEKEKAEKVAAARKRYEQLKKQKAKEGKKTKKSKDTKADEADPSNADAAPEAEEDVKDDTKDEESTAVEGTAAATEQTEEADDPEPEDDPIDQPADSSGERQPSLSLQSILRSESFRRSPSQPLISPGTAGLRSPTTADGESVSDLFKKQVAKIDQLEKENKRLEKELEGRSKALRKSEGHLEDLQEAHGDVAELKAKAAKADLDKSEMEKLRDEVNTLQRQNSYLQTQASSNTRKRTTSTAASSPPAEDLTSQLATKTSTIESQELEISNLRHSLSTQKTDFESKIRSLESSLRAAEESSTNAKTQLSELKATIDAPKPETGERSQKDAENRIILLESDLSAAQRSATDAQSRAESLEKKTEMLTTLHKESDARAQQQNAARALELEKAKTEASDLRRRLGAISNENARLRERKAREDRSGVEGDGGGVEDIEEEERNRLEARVRELEAEVFELRRGAWRERRRELGAAGEDGADYDEAVASPNGFDDVDLSAPVTPWGNNSRRQSSPYGAFSNVINAFTGSGGGGGNNRMGSRRQSSKSVQQTAQHPGGFEEFDEDDFDEDAFRKAREEQERARLERVREIKRGLNEWKGWRVDLVESRGGAMAGVFDV